MDYLRAEEEREGDFVFVPGSHCTVTSRATLPAKINSQIAMKNCAQKN